MIDLDLSSINGAIRARGPTYRKQLRNPSQKTTHSTPQQLDPLERSNHGLGGSTNQDNLTPEVTEGGAHRAPDQSRTTASALQILDFSSQNPIIAFENQLYSCSWSDMIGTNLFFTQNEDPVSLEGINADARYEVLGTSRIKLVGSKAKVTQKPPIRKRGRPPRDEEKRYREIHLQETTGKSLGDLHYSNAKVNMDVKKQAKFLEKLMDVKLARGDRDNVRTVVTKNITAARKRPRVESEGDTVKHEALDKKIEQLNRRVLRGDTEALTKLQRIYSALEPEDVTETTNPSRDALLPENDTASIQILPDVPN